MKLLAFTLAFCFSGLVPGVQFERYVGKNGKVKFTSDAPLELIEAASNKLSGVLDPQNNQFAFQIKINTFEGFNSDLQKGHFNENYMESSKFPKATFTGKLIEQIDLEKDGRYQVRAKGKLNIHGVEQVRIIKVTLTVANGKINARSKFTVPLTDHDITVPKIVYQKIATEIDVSINIDLVKE